MSEPVPRNAPCPCGSGKKYKHCCIDKPGQQPGASAGKRTGLIVAAVVVAGIGLFALTQTRRQPAAVPAAPTTAPAPAGNFQVPLSGAPAPAGPAGPAATPKPYEYDAVNNRHWDPNHGHWHDGPPPANAAAAPATTPKPYEYDAANNRHWDPNHGHWHSGPPPEQSAPVESTTEESTAVAPSAEQ
jgi:hypothetical protein